MPGHDRTRVRPDSPRVDYDNEPSEEATEILKTAISRDGTPLNIFRTLSHHPKMLKRFNLMGGFILNKGLLPPREREIVILRVGWRAQAVYEFGQHTEIGLRCGLSSAEIGGLAGAEHTWSEGDRLLIALADELCDDDCVTDSTYAALAERWSDAEMMELVITAGFYRLVSGFLNTFGVQLDEGVPGWPSP
jgi:4-carboxymuconolactone decarboxylase